MKKTLKQLQGWKIALVVLGVITTSLAALFAIINVQYQQRVEVLRKEVERIQEVSMVPAQGVERSSSERCTDFPPIGWSDISCPEVSRTWLVPIEKIESKSVYLENLGKALGYEHFTEPLGDESYSSLRVYTGKSSLELSASSVVDQSQPYPLSDDKEWVEIRALLTESSYIPAKTE